MKNKMNDLINKNFFLSFIFRYANTINSPLIITYCHLIFKKLQDKWKVSGLRLFLILITFAVGGSLTGYAGKKIMSFTGIETAGIYIPVYIIVVTLIWPLMVIVVSIFTGQFVFFKGYLKKMGRRMGGKRKSGVRSQESGVGSQELGVGSRELEEQEEMINAQRSMFNNQRETENKITTTNDQRSTANDPSKRLAIFASGAGSNAQQIINYFKSTSSVATVSLIVCNKTGAGVLQIAKTEGIDSLLIERERFFYGDAYLPVFQEAKIDLIALAGFLWKVPLPLIHVFRNRIINIHPALLPKYGGKGMYGNKVHESVIKAGETESGITIHLVDEDYDEGDIIFQATCFVLPGDTPETVAQRIHQLEYEHYPKVIEKLIKIL